MTAKRGTLWKTSWRRQKPGIAAAPVPMWFFKNNGGAPGSNFVFTQPLTAPGIGDGTPPFWVGMICGSEVFTTPALPTPEGSGAFRTSAWTAEAQHFTPSSGTPNELRALASGGVSPNLEEELPLLSSPLSPISLRAVALMLVVEKIGATDLLESLWIDGALRQQRQTVNTYAPGVGTLTFDPGRSYINSMAGGNALPTTQEIRDWFQQTRYATPFPSAQPIPGKTLDRYDAGATPGVVPNPLVNLAGGQNAPLVVSGFPPNPANLLVNATFAY